MYCLFEGRPSFLHAHLSSVYIVHCVSFQRIFILIALLMVACVFVVTLDGW